MPLSFSDYDDTVFKEIRSHWEAATGITSVEEIGFSVGDAGKWVSGRIYVSRGRLNKELALGLQDVVRQRIPDITGFSVVATDSTGKTIEYVWNLGEPWQERKYPAK